MVKVRKVKRERKYLERNYTKRKFKKSLFHSKYEKGFHDGFQACLELENLRRTLEKREKNRERTKEELRGKKVFYCLSDEEDTLKENTQEENKEIYPPQEPTLQESTLQEKLSSQEKIYIQGFTDSFKEVTERVLKRLNKYYEMLNYNKVENPRIYYERQLEVRSKAILDLEENFKQYFKELEKKLTEQAIGMWNEV